MTVYLFPLLKDHGIFFLLKIMSLKNELRCISAIFKPI